MLLFALTTSPKDCISLFFFPIPSCPRTQNGQICHMRHLISIHPEAIAERYMKGLLSEAEIKLWGLTPCEANEMNPFSNPSSHVCFDYSHSHTCARNSNAQICRFKHCFGDCSDSNMNRTNPQKKYEPFMKKPVPVKISNYDPPSFFTFPSENGLSIDQSQPPAPIVKALASPSPSTQSPSPPTEEDKTNIEKTSPIVENSCSEVLTEVSISDSDS